MILHLDDSDTLRIFRAFRTEEQKNHFGISLKENIIDIDYHLIYKLDISKLMEIKFIIWDAQEKANLGEFDLVRM